MFSLQTIFGSGKQFYTLLDEAAQAAQDQGLATAQPKGWMHVCLLWLWGRARAQAKRFSMKPMPSISTRTTSPAFRNCGGLRPMPTPAGVPVAITSPG